MATTKVSASDNGMAMKTPVSPNQRGSNIKPATGSTRLRITAITAEGIGLCSAVKHEDRVMFIPLNRKAGQNTAIKANAIASVACSPSDRKAVTSKLGASKK